MKILIVEDDVHLSSAIKKDLCADTHIIEVANTGKDGAFLARSYHFDAIILDFSLPVKDGITVCKEIRTAGNNTPIIFLSAYGDTELKIKALDSGADDYMIKPFSMSEMKSRIKAITRRPNQIARENILTIDNIQLDISNHTVTRAGKEIPFTNKEFALLEYLLRNKGVMLSRAMIMEHVWSADRDPFSNTVEVHICNLRRKLNKGKQKNLIVNMSGRGYMLKE